MKYYIWVLGCAMNRSDAERIASVFSLLGFLETKDEKQADIIVTVACSVRQSAIDRIYGKAKSWARLKNKNKKLKTILTGCVLPEDKKKLQKSFDFIAPIEEIGSLTKFLNSNSQISGDYRGFKDYLAITPRHESFFRAYVPIMTGCDNFCSYCAVPYVRGREKSRPKKEILDEIKALVKNGYKEITLLGQNVNSYGKTIRDKGTGTSKGKFGELLKEIDKIPGDYRVYFYSNHPKDISSDLIRTLPKLIHFPNYLHLPLQSGSNEILKLMNRHYTSESYLELVAKIKKEIPDINLTTDIMVGFPGETKKQFRDTKKIMETVGFDMAFLAQYSPRPETASAKLKDSVSKSEKKEREDELQKILAKTALKNNQNLEGKVVSVLIDSEKNGKYYGRTDSYKVVEIEYQKNPELAIRAEGSRGTVKNSSHKRQNIKIGEFAKVKIEKAEPWKLLATLF